LLRNAGLVVETVDNGQRAVELCGSRHYDLVLLDVQMPVMDGLEAARLIRAQLGRALPIVAMTANAFSEDRAACLEAGMNDHIGKPVDGETLYTVLLRWLPLPRGLAEPPAPVIAVPVARDAGALRARLSHVAGLDMTEALRLFGGRLPQLERSLHNFVEFYAQGEPALLECGAEVPTARWLAVAHSLRGACSSVGCNKLAAQLQSFEQRLGRAEAAHPESNSLAAQARQLHDELRAMVERLDQALKG
jgi:CheY-like chemotaxis protein